jgi:hypothetical protein
MQYRKKAVIIEAIQFTGQNYLSMSKFFGANSDKYDAFVGYMVITTLEGEMRANPGDWIIKGIKGEFYPCKPDIFEATYEKVEEQCPTK